MSMIKKVPSKAPKSRKGKATQDTPERATVAEAAAMAADSSVLERLYEVVHSRKGTDPSVSHSARLLSRGTSKIAQKFGEEAVECLIEAVAGRRTLLVGESADVLYHLTVMLAARAVSMDEVLAELDRRAGTSGIAEKAARG